MTPLLIGDLGTPELLIILAVVVLMFGSAKLPELARGSGRALRIFKEETRDLTDEKPATPATSATSATTPSPTTSSPAPDA